MDDSTEQTSGREPLGGSSPSESARPGAFSAEPHGSTMPATGIFPVVSPQDLARERGDEAVETVATPAPSQAHTSALPAADFPTEQHRAGGHHALPELGEHHPTVTAGLGAAPSFAAAPYPGPQFPGGPGFPMPPAAPAIHHPTYAGAPRRHPWEIPLLVLVVLVTVLIYVGAIAAAFAGWMNTYLLLALAIPALVWFGRGSNWAAPRVQGIQMTPTQFPEGYRMVREAAERYGLREVPDAFVVLGNGQINAFASGHGFRRFVVIYSDLFEVGGAARDPEALAYIIGHEVGHIAAGHVSYWRQLGSFAMSYLPFIGAALSRAQEYTADNYGYFNRPSGTPGGMGLLGAGKYLGKEVDFDQLADRASTDRGFFTWLVNLTASHPVLTWRAAALRNRTKAGSLWFAPKLPVRGIGGGAVLPAGPMPAYNRQEVLAPTPGGAAPVPPASPLAGPPAPGFSGPTVPGAPFTGPSGFVYGAPEQAPPSGQVPVVPGQFPGPQGAPGRFPTGGFPAPSTEPEPGPDAPQP